jgi:hypothetical protein
LIRDSSKSTGFLNVDLEIFSKRDLQPLIGALGEKVLVLDSALERRTYRAHLELTRIPSTPDAMIRAFCALIEGLPKPARHLWTQAKRRDFNIGVEAGTSSRRPREFALSTETLKAAHRLGARIAFTVYAAEKLQQGRQKRRTPTDRPD